MKIITKFNTKKSLLFCLTSMPLLLLVIFWSLSMPGRISAHFSVPRAAHLWPIMLLGTSMFLILNILFLIDLVFFNSRALYIKNYNFIFVHPIIFSIHINSVSSVNWMPRDGFMNYAGELCFCRSSGRDRIIRTDFFAVDPREAVTEINNILYRYRQRDL